MIWEADAETVRVDNGELEFAILGARADAVLDRLWVTQVACHHR